MLWLVEFNMDGIIQYISKDCEYIAQFIYPHNGTDYKYVARINKTSTFERWSHAETEEWFDDERQAFDFLCNFKEPINEEELDRLATKYAVAEYQYELKD